MRIPFAVVLVTLSLSACAEPATRPSSEAPAPDGSTTPPAARTASLFCRYTNPFSREDECKAYVGGEWNAETARDDCGKVFTGAMGVLGGEVCNPAGAIGTCTTESGGARETVTWYYGGDPAVTESACATFANGTWGPADVGIGGQTTAFGDPMPEALLALESGSDVSVTPSCADETCIVGLIEARRGIELSPANARPTTGLIVFPGASVDVRAYAPIARLIARQGYLVVLVPVPNRFALSAFDRTHDVMKAHPEIERWVVGGHSMGGAAAASFVRTNPGVAAGLVLWGAYASDGDAIRDTMTYDLFGTQDLVATPEEIETHRAALPENALIIPIRGGNHAQFGAYGPQSGDGEATIPRAAQHALVAGVTTHLLRRVSTQDVQAPHPAFERANAETAEFCRQAQRLVAGTSTDVLPDASIDDEAWTDAVGFGRAKPEITGRRESPLKIHSYASQGANPRWMREPPILEGEIWCKMKSKAAIETLLGRQGDRPAGTCASANAAILERATALLAPEERETYRRSRRAVAFEDVTTMSGPEWYSGVVEADIEGSTLHLRAPALDVPLDADVAESGRGVSYCKLWSLGRALEWLLFTDVSMP